MQSGFDAGVAKVQQAADSGERACVTTSADGCQIIRGQIDKLQAECRVLKQQLQEAQCHVQQALDRLEDTNKTLESMMAWSKDTAVWLRDQKEATGDAADRHLQLQKVKVSIFIHRYYEEFRSIEPLN